MSANLRIAVRAPNWLGDAIMATAFLSELKEAHPGARVSVFCRAAHRPLFESAGLSAEAVAVDEPRFSLGRLARRLREGRYELGYILPLSFSSALAFAWGAVRRRVGHGAQGRSFLLTEAVSLDARFHYVRRYLSLIGREGLADSALRLNFPLTEAGRSEWARLKASWGVSLKAPFLAVAPGSQAAARRWAPERFALVAGRFVKETGGSVLLVGARSDRAAAEEVRRHAPGGLFNACGGTSLEGLGAVLKECVALLTNESGAMHAAWALGVPSVVIAGPSDPALTAPWGEAATILEKPEVWCVPCVRNDCPRWGNGHKECLARIGVDEVWEVLRERIEVRI